MTSDSWPPNTPSPCSPATNWEVGMVSTNSRSSRRKYQEEVVGGSTRRKYPEEVPGGSTQRKYPEEVPGGSTQQKYLARAPCSGSISFFPIFFMSCKNRSISSFFASLSHFIKHQPLISEGCWLKFCLVYPDNILVGGLGKFIAHCNWRSFFKNLFFVVISH